MQTSASGHVSAARPGIASRFAWLAAAIVLAVVQHAAVEAQDRAYSADEVKAAFLYHFGTYVDWPEGRRQGPLTIAVLGAASVAQQLAAYLPGRTIGGRAVAVRPIARIEDLGDAAELFIGEGENARLGEVIAKVGQRPVLIVTDSPNGLASGAMVNFQLVDRRVRFEISLKKAQSAGLNLSSRLLAAALRVEQSRCWFDCRQELPKPGVAETRGRPAGGV
jgi:hypothetical protein